MFTKRLILTASLMLAASIGAAQTTYVFNTASGAFGDAASWNPARNAPAANDILSFNANATVTGLSTQSIGQLVLSNNAQVIFNGTTGAEAEITITGGANALSIPAGTSLRLTGGGSANAIALVVADGSTATIGGDFILNATAGTTPHRLEGRAANQIIFTSGSSAAMAPTTTGAGNGFGSSTGGFANSVIFQSGSLYVQGGEKDGTRNGGTGSNPFARTAPNSNVVFEPGSTYLGLGIALAVSGRTYASYVHRDGYGAARTVTGASAWTLTNDLRFLPPGGTLASAATPTPGTFAYNVTAPLNVAGEFEIATGGARFIDGAVLTGPTAINFGGNVSIASPALFTVSTSTERSYVFNGTAQQTVNVNGAHLHQVVVDNAAGVLLTSPLTVSLPVTLTSGNFSASGFGGLILAGTATTPAGYTGPVGSAVTFDATSLSPVSTEGVTFTQSAAGTGTGLFGVVKTPGPGTGIPGAPANTGSTQIWNIAAPGVGGINGTLVISYLDSEITNIDEADLKLARFDGTNWVDVPATVDAVANTITATGVTAFSPWTLYGAALSTSAAEWKMYE